jgi:hypothetical protein
MEAKVLKILTSLHKESVQEETEYEDDLEESNNAPVCV